MMSTFPRFKSPFSNSRERSSSPESDTSTTPLPWKMGSTYAGSLTGERRKSSIIPLFTEKERKPSVAPFHGDLVKGQESARKWAGFCKVLICVTLFITGLMAGVAIGYWGIAVHTHQSSGVSNAETIVETTSAAAAATSAVIDLDSKAAKNNKNNNFNNGGKSAARTTTSSTTTTTSARKTSTTTTKATPTTTSKTTSKSMTTSTTKTTSKTTAKAAAATAAAAGTATSYWQPAASNYLQIILSAVVTDTSSIAAPATVFQTDLFDTPASTIAMVKAKGTKVVCYFSAGTAEDWRTDYSSFQAADLGAALDGWAGETWVDTRSTNVRNIMAARIALAASKGCDGIEPDNVDVYGYGTASGFSGLTLATSIDYMTYLANTAHSAGLGIGLKNGGDMISSIQSLFQWVTSESCVNYNECNIYQPFVTAGKPVFNIQYPFGSDDDSTTTVSASTLKKWCNGVSKISGMTTLLKHQSLDAWIYSC